MSLGVTVINPPQEYGLSFGCIHSTRQHRRKPPLGRQSALPLNFSAYQENGLQFIFSFNAKRSNHHPVSPPPPEMSPKL